MNKSAAYDRLKALAAFASTTRVIRKIARYKLAGTTSATKSGAGETLAKNSIGFNHGLSPQESTNPSPKKSKPKATTVINPLDFGPTAGLMRPMSEQSQPLEDLRHEWANNRFNNIDTSIPQVIQTEVPITNGIFPVAWHTQTSALMPEKKWNELPLEEKVKYRGTFDRNGNKVYWRTYSTSAEIGNPQSTANSDEGDWFFANSIILGRDGEVRPRSTDPRVWLKAKKPIRIYYPCIVESRDKDGNIQKEIFEAWRDSTDDLIGSLAPSNLAQIELYDSRLDENGNRMPIVKTINDAMNAGERISNIMSNQRPYKIFTNNCHFGTISANSLNPYFKPGSFSSGGSRGFTMDSDDDPFNKYFWSRNPVSRWFVPFYVKQRTPTEENYTQKREAALDAFEKKMRAWNEYREEVGPYQAFPIP